MAIKIILLLFIAFAASRVWLKYRSRDITPREAVAWLVFWGLVVIAVLLPQQTDALAAVVGVGRGADLLVYISIVVLFFAVFRLTLQLKKNDQALTELVRRLALEKNRDDV